MFSGIVAAIGRITQLSPRADENSTVRLTIDAGTLGLDDVALGDSIACNGVCLTVVEKRTARLSAWMSRGDPVLHGRPRRAGRDQPGEGTAPVGSPWWPPGFRPRRWRRRGAALRCRRRGDETCRLLEIRAPQALTKYIAKKGSVTVNGTSLTTNEVRGTDFTINLIPHTHCRTRRCT